MNYLADYDGKSYGIYGGYKLRTAEECMENLKDELNRYPQYPLDDGITMAIRVGTDVVAELVVRRDVESKQIVFEVQR
jgi:hypothetical protein